MRDSVKTRAKPRAKKKVSGIVVGDVVNSVMAGMEKELRKFGVAHAFHEHFPANRVLIEGMVAAICADGGVGAGTRSSAITAVSKTPALGGGKAVVDGSVTVKMTARDFRSALASIVQSYAEQAGIGISPTPDEVIGLTIDGGNVRLVDPELVTITIHREAMTQGN